MRIVPLDFNEEDILNGVYAISIVDMPAIEENFVTLSKNPQKYVLAKTEEQCLIGPALIPNKMILRVDEMGEPYQIYFTPETVKKAAYALLKKGYLHNYTEQHNQAVDNVYMEESWIIEDEELDKAKYYGFDLPKGTWMVKVKVKNKELWKRIKSGKYKGFSIEAFFVENLQAESVEQNLENANLELEAVIKTLNE